jgi:hypothetical protein
MTKGMISISPSLTSLTYVVIFQLHLCMMYIHRSLFDMLELVRHTISFQFEAVYWQISWCQGVSTVSFTGNIPQYLWSLQRSYLPIQPFFGPHTVWYVSYQSLSRSWHTHRDYSSYRLSNLDIGLTVGVAGQPGILTPPWHLIPPLINSEVCVRPISDLYFL